MKKIEINYNEEIEGWSMTTTGINNTEAIGVLALMLDNVRYHRLFKIEEALKKLAKKEENKNDL